MLSDFSFDIIHIQGKENVVADALSRLTQQEEAQSAAATPINIIEEEERLPQETEAGAAPQVNNEAPQAIRRHQRAIDHDADIAQMHGGVNGHFGVQATLTKLREAGLAWPTMKKDVLEYVASCVECQKVMPSLKQVVEKFPLRDTAVDAPFRVISMDAMGPFPVTDDGYIYLLVLIDCFTRWTELVPTKTLEATECADALIAAIFCRHGLPFCIRSDRGTQYINRVIEELLKKLKIQHHRVLPYTPQANGIVERQNREILKHLRILSLEFGAAYNEWTMLLPIVQFIVNRSTHSSLGMSPHSMLYGDFWDVVGN